MVLPSPDRSQSSTAGMVAGLGKQLELCIRPGSRRLQLLAVLLFTLLACVSNPLLGQQAGGIIAGAVYDPSGAVVPEASVIVTNVDTGEEYQTRTNGSGTFTTPSLRIGRYSVTASHAGFKAMVERNLVLQVDARVEVSIK